MSNEKNNNNNDNNMHSNSLVRVESIKELTTLSLAIKEGVSVVNQP
jgi:hypothetical protein